MKCNVRPYEGNEPYIFFSYCHEDEARDYPIIEKMASDGYRIWYDDGLHPGDDWPERIAQMLADCTVCIAALSQKFSESHNCKNELTFAINNQKPLLVIKLEDFPMSVGMRLQLANTQYIEKYRYDSEYSFFAELYSTRLEELEKCKGRTLPVPIPRAVSTPQPQPDLPLPSPILDQTPDRPVIIQCSTGRLFIGSYPSTSVGRDRKCDISFPENHAVGRHHIDIMIHEKKRYVVDKDSANHTWVNGKCLEKGARCETGPHAEIKIADEQLFAAFGGTAEFLKEHKLLVRLQSETTKESRYLLTEIFMLGRSHAWPGGALSDRHISREHAVLKMMKKGCMLSDVSTYNQTWVNEKRIPPKEEYLLSDKDVIRIGGHGGERFTVYMITLEDA